MQHSSEEQQGDRGKEKLEVLVVDDEQVIRHVCQLSLQREGYPVRTAENGLASLEMLRDNPDIGIVVTDMNMPGLGGLELLSTIKRDFPHIEVIIMTGFATIESAIDAMKLGAYDFILKPLKAEQIRMVVNKCNEKILLSNENLMLKDTNVRLRELQAMKDKFLAITSHELRTPVSHLKGYLSIINDDYFEELPQNEKEDCMRVIVTAVADLEEIVQNMYQVLQLERNQTLLRMEDVNISEMLEQLITEFRYAAKHRHHSLELEVLSKITTIRGDRLKIKGLLSELIRNAIKFTNDGGQIRVTQMDDGTFCQISVKDNGIGISEEEQGKIFEKFYEVQNTDYHSTSRFDFKGGGLGIGLPLARAIAEAHGGGIKLVSQPEKGSEFLVLLPIKNSHA